MRVSGLLLLVALTAACTRTTTDEVPEQRTDNAPQQLQQGSDADAPERPSEAQREALSPDAETRSKAAAAPRPAGTRETSSTGLSEPRIASTATANETAVALADFKKRVEKYAELHKDLAKGSAKQRETADPAKLNNAKTALAAKIQAARPDAKQGDIFTPAVRPIFRRLLAPELKGAEGRDTKAVLADDAPAPGTVAFKVNAKYPDAQPLPTVPANVLATLPALPEPLEYRIVGQHLLLLDTAADVIVDYILNAITK